MESCVEWPKTKHAQLGYIAALDRASELHLRGEKQIRCKACRRYYWLEDRSEHV